MYLPSALRLPIASVLVFTCVSSAPRLADTLFAFLMYVPSALRLPIASAFAFTCVSSLPRFSATFLPASTYVPLAIVPILLSTAVIAPAFAFTCVSSAPRFVDTLFAFLMYVPSALRLPILLSILEIESVFFLILVFNAEASTVIVGPLLFAFVFSVVDPLPLSSILMEYA